MASQKDSDHHKVGTNYPFATAGINISRMMFDILIATGDEKKPRDFYDILFEHDFALEQLVGGNKPNKLTLGYCSLIPISNLNRTFFLSYDPNSPPPLLSLPHLNSIG